MPPAKRCSSHDVSAHVFDGVCFGGKCSRTCSSGNLFRNSLLLWNIVRNAPQNIFLLWNELFGTCSKGPCSPTCPRISSKKVLWNLLWGEPPEPPLEVARQTALERAPELAENLLRNLLQSAPRSLLDLQASLLGKNRGVHLSPAEPPTTNTGGTRVG